MINRKKLSGFTLVELLVTLMIFSTLSLLVVPSYFSYQSRQAISLKAWEIKRALELARSIAVSEYIQIKACLAGSNYGCVANSGTKFLVFKDSNNNHQWDTDEPIYKDIGIEDFNIKLSASGRASVRFRSTGEAMESGNIQICNIKKTDFSKQIIFIYSGRIRMSTDENRDGYDEKNGRNIACNNGALGL
ncbi:MAG: GspH/FimT family pseudopilin [Porticoccaceae bacterium]|nr:GspH/FimT family pseudopilin [Porticoccaceae bacterium]